MPEVAGHQGGVHGVLAPGFNPKDTAETYVRKIMTNQKRMQQTIKKYEEEQKAKVAEAFGKTTNIDQGKQISEDKSILS